MQDALPSPMVAAQSSEVTYLESPEIERLMSDGLLKGVNSFGNPYTITYSADGGMSGVAGHQGEYKDTGKWWVKEDMFCRQYQAWLEAKAACFKIRLDNNNISFYDSDGNFVSGGRFERNN